MKDRAFFIFPLQVLAAIWAVFLLNMLIPIEFNRFGLLPRTAQGLIGIFTSPFLHGGLGHIMSNSVPLFVLLCLLTLFFRHSFDVILTVIVISGAMLWVVGRPSYHVGASGLVYGLAGFIMAFGVFRKRLIPIVLAVAVALTYGLSFLVGLLPIFPGVSWEGHLCGAIAGIITAKMLTGK